MKYQQFENPPPADCIRRGGVRVDARLVISATHLDDEHRSAMREMARLPLSV
jgi:hypothetical protein